MTKKVAENDILKSENKLNAIMIEKIQKKMSKIELENRIERRFSEFWFQVCKKLLNISLNNYFCSFITYFQNNQSLPFKEFKNLVDSDLLEKKSGIFSLSQDSIFIFNSLTDTKPNIIINLDKINYSYFNWDQFSIK